VYKALFSSILFLPIFLHAQDKKALDSIDKVVIAQIITPAEQQAARQNQPPAWDEMTKEITAKYSATEADRAVTKARIYFYYGKDWALFSAALVHYTTAYEDKEDLRLMNKNATYVLQHSTNPEEWKTARGWVKHAVDKEPSNATYKATYDALTEKIIRNKATNISQ